MRVMAYIKDGLSLDYRSLAFYRFFMGLIVMIDALYRTPYLTDFYTDVGLVPRSTFMTEMSMPWSFSFHFANGSLAFAVIMFSLHTLVGFLMMIGYKTRWASVAAFLFTISVHNRNWLINNGGDDILRAILFLSMFLPLNRYFSVDSALKAGPRPVQKSFFSTWTLAVYLQVFMIYFVSYILKDHPIWRSQFTAIFFASRLDIFATGIGVWLRQFPLLQKGMTIFTILLEWLGPLFLVGGGIFGKRAWMIRVAVVALFIGLHVGIIFTMWIGVFPYLCVVIWPMFLPGEFWDRLENYYFQKREKFTLYFDRDCGFCRKTVLLLREFLLLSGTTIAPAQDHPKIHAIMEKNNSWVVVKENGEELLHFNGVKTLFKNSPIFFWLTPLMPSAIGNVIYSWVASHRNFMSGLSQFFHVNSETRDTWWIKSARELAGAFIIATLLMWNLGTIKRWNISSPFFQNVTRYLHLYQEWNMFAPYPKVDNVWIEIPALLGDGSQIELLTGDRDVYSVKSDRFPKDITNEHWRKFYLNVSDSTTNAKYFAGFLCRKWNDRHEQLVPGTTLKSMEIIVYSQLNLIDGSRGGINKKLSWKHWCFDEDYKKEFGH